MKKTYYIFTSGELHRKDNLIQFIDLDGNKKDMPIETVSDIYIMSDMKITTKLLNYLSKYGIVVHFFNYYDFYTGSYYPKEKLVSGKLLINQVLHFTDQEKRLAIAKEFVNGASYNIHRNIRYYNSRGKDLENQLNDIEFLRKKINLSKDIKELMGYEGNIRKIYYTSWNEIIKQEINFEKRVYRTPDNMINSLISYVNSLIYTRVLSAIYNTQLNPTISYLHEPSTRRFSLSLDIAEIFKPLLGDRLIFSILNKNQITEKHFTKGLEYLHLTESGSKIIAQELDKRLKTTIKHKDLSRDVSYEHLIKLECYKLIKHLMGEKEYQSFKIWW
ncbi:MAG: type I-B CRISPR-associated endonuclease Cas1b [Clostridioides sp.]|jgi:CRISPR-associated protein Cas1|nr:type I-B CRISPR-associated endonuclease Cas1b [Clostridioides sp.]